MGSTGEDALQVLEIFINDVANLPAEISHIYEEITHKDSLLRTSLETARSRDASLQKHIRLHTSLEPHPKEAVYTEQVRRNLARVRELQDEKIALAQKALELVERHVRRLDAKITELVREGAMQPIDVRPAQNNLPARPVPAAQAAAQAQAQAQAAAQAQAQAAGAVAGGGRGGAGGAGGAGAGGTGAAAAVAAMAAAVAAAERQGTPGGGFRRPARERKKREEEEEEGIEDKRLYCTCREVSYGSMVGCDDRDCPFEWFHWGCVGLTEEPVGKWYCPPCTERRARTKATRGA